jgi:hypothetical protein
MGLPDLDRVRSKGDYEYSRFRVAVEENLNLGRGLTKKTSALVPTKNSIGEHETA